MAGSKVTQCPYWYEGPGLSREVRCDEAAGHGGHHEVDTGDDLTFRWTSDVAVWRDPKVSVEDVLDKLRRHGKVTSNPPLEPAYLRRINNERQADLHFRWKRDVAEWQDPQVTVGDGEVTPNPPLTRTDLEQKPSGHDHADDEACTAACTQVGGDHYVKRAIGPWDVWSEYGMNAFEGAVLKYLLRWRDKGGVEDLKKARHTLDKLIELEEAKGDPEAG